MMMRLQVSSSNVVLRELLHKMILVRFVVVQVTSSPLHGAESNSAGPIVSQPALLLVKCFILFAFILGLKEIIINPKKNQESGAKNTSKI